MVVIRLIYFFPRVSTFSTATLFSFKALSFVALSLTLPLTLMGCEKMTTDVTAHHEAPSESVDIDTNSDTGLDTDTHAPQPSSIASSVHSISRHIANTVMSGDAVNVVHEIIMPTDVPVTLTGYQQAYLESMHTAWQARKEARQANDDADIIFVLSTIAHHQSAIRMANIELEYGTDDDMRKLAQDIIINEQNEILLFQNWLASQSNQSQLQGQSPQEQATKQKQKLNHDELNHDELRREYANGLDDMSNQMMLGIMSPNPDVAFAQAMLPHHKGALAMAQVELRYGDDEKVRHMADIIIDTQESEIQLIQQWLQQFQKVLIISQ